MNSKSNEEKLKKIFLSKYKKILFYSKFKNKVLLFIAYSIFSILTWNTLNLLCFQKNILLFLQYKRKLRNLSQHTIIFKRIKA